MFANLNLTQENKTAFTLSDFRSLIFIVIFSYILKQCFYNYTIAYNIIVYCFGAPNQPIVNGKR